MTKPDQILAVLRQHIGRENAVGAAEIAVAIGWKPSRSRDVRKIISAHRADWTRQIEGAVCNASGGGFWIGVCFEDVEDLVHYFDHAEVAAKRKAREIRSSLADIGFTAFARRAAASISAHDAIEKVLAHQKAHGLTDRAIAKELSVSPATWSTLKNGRYPGKHPAKFIKAAAAFLAREGAE